MISWWFRTTFVKVTTDLQNVRGREVTSKPEGHCQFRLSLSEVLLTHSASLASGSAWCCCHRRGPCFSPLLDRPLLANLWTSTAQGLGWTTFLNIHTHSLGDFSQPEGFKFYKLMTTRFLSLALTFPRLLTLPFVCRRHSTHTINVFQIKFLILLVSFSSYF